jgi:hypothetical protein
MNQTEAILQHLKGAPITPIEALNHYGCFRLGARIYDLRAAGHQIKSELIERNGKKFAQYSLA